MTRPTCATCRAFETNHPNEKDGIGECRLHAPVQSYFPTVYGYMWCLEHIPNYDERAEPITQRDS